MLSSWPGTADVFQSIETTPVHHGAGRRGGVAARGHAQQGERIRRIGILAGYDDPDMKVFQPELERLGWSGRNAQIEYRYAPAGAQVQAFAKELVALQPDVIFAQSRPVTTALQRETRTIPDCVHRGH